MQTNDPFAGGSFDSLPPSACALVLYHLKYNLHE